MNKCKYCGADGIIKEIGGLFYAYCTKCDGHIKLDGDQWQYVGVTRSGCTHVWNQNNIPGRISNKVKVF